MASAWGKSWGAAWGAAWGQIQPPTPAPVLEKDDYKAIANRIYNLRTDGPANNVFMRIGHRRSKRQ